jgi:tetratricopeptide (TPR) repeat protein
LLALVTIAVTGWWTTRFMAAGWWSCCSCRWRLPCRRMRRAGWALRLNLAWPGLALAGLLVAALPAGRARRLVANLGAVEQGRAELSLYSWPEWRLQDEVRRAAGPGPAVARYEQALALDADDFSANRRMGQIALSLGDYEAALAYLAAGLRGACPGTTPRASCTARR